ncbi:MAG: FtsX-like permease family protein [Lachnospiraceae bacterium]
MKRGFYPKLALTGIRKNRQTYIPYLLTCIGMVAMFYIVYALSKNDALAAMRGGDTLQAMLSLGTGIMGIFAVIFLFYTNSFLIRRRKKEFGLYNILGMGKRNLARVLIWECAIMYAISVAGGLFCGILFSKLGELCMARMLGEKAGFDFFVSFTSIKWTAVLFLAIFILILINNLRQIQMSRPVELLHGDETAEKPPKANWLLALVGVVLLGTAYFLAVVIDEPLSALTWFFVAVVMVIAATYLLFIAGSVVFCRLLQKNKAFYYKTSHFISVSSMAYRMKQNGAGLASICILSTMVLVTLSSTVCLYIGLEDSLHHRYPRDIVVETSYVKEQDTERVHENIGTILEEYGETPENELHYRYLPAGTFFEGNTGHFDYSKVSVSSKNSEIDQLFVISIDDYNRLMEKNETLTDDEALIFCTKRDWQYDTVELDGVGTWKIKETVPEFVSNGVDAMQMVPSVYLFVSDLKEIEASMTHVTMSDGMEYRITGIDYYGFDLNCDDEKQTAILKTICEKGQNGISGHELEDGQYSGMKAEGIAGGRSDFYGLYGGLFFLGIFLGIVFILGAVLIMYYKQIIEGYEDRKRFAILQQVGMTENEIRKSINSQILMVFFLPLAVAGIHTAFAFPIVSRILLLLGLVNTKLLIGVTAACYLLFALFYVSVYMATSRVYYGIVTGEK